MATVKLWTDEEASADARVKAVFDDIRVTRKFEFVNNFWRALANQPALLERTWASVKQVMIEPGALDPLTKELIYIAVSTLNGCSYCIRSHTCGKPAPRDSQASSIPSFSPSSAWPPKLTHWLRRCKFRLIPEFDL